MVSLKHSAKKRFNRNTTRTKTIQSGISTEYTDLRRKLDMVTSSLKSLMRLIKNTRTVWTSVAKHQKDFCEALVSSLPTSGVVQDHAKEVEVLVRSVHPKFLEGDNGESPDNKLCLVLEAYLKQIDGVREQYPDMEMAYTEVLRYQRKVDKLEAKGARKNEALQRNMTKLDAAHAKYEERLNLLLERMRAEYAKNEAVFQCAHHAFWLAQHRYTTTLDGVTRNIRGESVVVQHPLLRTDVVGTKALAPVPRMRPAVHVIEPAPGAANVLSIEPGPKAEATNEAEFVDALPDAKNAEVGNKMTEIESPEPPKEMPRPPAPKLSDTPAASAPALAV